MKNHLAGTNSPYLLQHAENPVDWYPWDSEAFERARNEDKPIFLSIGYAACHWCHVMAHESFEDAAIATILNADFISIKVDREERPDIDQIYMQAVVAMTGKGGWPISLFLTPDEKPFFGGTYFPPSRKYNLPSFEEILTTIAGLWKKDRKKLLDSGQQITAHLQMNQTLPASSEELAPSLLEKASLKLAQEYDWNYGGWGKAPKFPQPMVIEFLLRRSIAGDRMALEMTNHALTAMAQGGMYDVLGGGFARYSTDENWLVPHFEKMLYDNAQLARVYLHAYMLTRNMLYRKICEETLDFILRELSTRSAPDQIKGTGFYSSLDADSEGEEGNYYLWGFDDIQNTLKSSAFLDQEDGDLEPFTFFQAAYTFSPEGNFEGRNVLQRRSSDQVLASQFNLEIAQVQDYLSKINLLLFKVRDKRQRPGLDDKVLTSWNALALLAFSEAARYLQRADYLAAAQENAQFLIENMYMAGGLRRSWRQGQSQHLAFLEDYAGLISGLIALYQSDANPRWYTHAVILCEEMLEHFSDSEGGFFDTRDDQETLIIRPKDLQDNATPSGNALATTALLALASLSGNANWRRVADKMVQAMQENAIHYPTAFAQWLCALDDAVHPTQEIALLSTTPFSEQPYIRILWNSYRPHTILARSVYPPNTDSPAVLRDKILVDDLPTAYVCENLVCHLPVNSPEAFERQLNATSKP